MPILLLLVAVGAGAHPDIVWSLQVLMQKMERVQMLALPGLSTFNVRGAIEVMTVMAL